MIGADSTKAQLEDELTLRLDSQAPLAEVSGRLADRVARETDLRPTKIWTEDSCTYYYDYQRLLALKHVRLRLKKTRQSQDSRCTLTAKWPVEQISPGRKVSLEVISYLRSACLLPVRASLLSHLTPARAVTRLVDVNLDDLVCVLHLRQNRKVLRYDIWGAPAHAVLDDVVQLDEDGSPGPLERYLDVEFPLARLPDREATLFGRLVDVLEAASAGSPSREGKIQGRLLQAGSTRR